MGTALWGAKVQSGLVGATWGGRLVIPLGETGLKFVRWTDQELSLRVDEGTRFSWKETSGWRWEEQGTWQPSGWPVCVLGVHHPRVTTVCVYVAPPADPRVLSNSLTLFTPHSSP